MATKLVRDGIPSLMLAACEGVDGAIQAAPSTHARDLLIAKLREEVEEVDDCLCLEELSDLLEAIYALLKHAKLGTPNDLEAVRVGKRLDRGGFDRLLVLDMDKYHVQS